ncbi:hypothetical protein IFR05_004879 [Cadophora sp. M221]|nr:hypothetical protein IFR05_004879 [Cadophora sp. M221]
MTEVGHIQLLGATQCSSPTTFTVQVQAEADPMQNQATTESQVCKDDNIRQSTSSMDGADAGSPATDDNDDVQIIFCAPRRRKKRRRRLEDISTTLKASSDGNRLESIHVASPVDQACGPQINAIPGLEIHHVAPQATPQRKSISAVRRLEFCQLQENKPPSGRADSLPSMPRTPNNGISSVQYPWFAEPSYCETPFSEVPSLMDSAAWLDQSLPTLEPRPLSSIRWRPLQMEDPDSKKRKQHGGFDDMCSRPNPLHQSVQTSPRTTPASATTSPLSPLFRNNSNQFHMVGTDQHLPASTAWPSIVRGPVDDVDKNHHGSNFTRQSPVLVDLSGSNADVPTSSPSHQSSTNNAVEQPRESDTWLPHSRQTSGTISPSQNRIPPIQGHHSSGSGNRVLQESQSLAQHSTPHASPPPSETLALNHINIPHIPPPVAPHRPGVQASHSHTWAPPIPPRGNTRVAQSSDMLRKPSLYSVPPWKNPANLPVPPIQSPNIQSHIRPPISSTNETIGRASEAVYPRINFAGRSHQSNIMRSQRADSVTQSQAIGIPPAKAATLVSSPPDKRSSPRVATFQIPNVRLGRKHSSNLIVDVAETCQELFPFAKVAERHEVPIQKVYDTFSAIIQLPLLRNADDRRRNGSLGKRRMKEYRDAKKAMEKAQEAARKTQKQDVRARAEDAEQKGRGPSKTQGLQNPAVPTNARVVHRVE